MDERDVALGSLAESTRELAGDRWETDFVNDGRDELARYLVRDNTIPNASAVVVEAGLLRCGWPATGGCGRGS